MRRARVARPERRVGVRRRRAARRARRAERRERVERGDELVVAEAAARGERLDVRAVHERARARAAVGVVADDARAAAREHERAARPAERRLEREVAVRARRRVVGHHVLPHAQPPAAARVAAVGLARDQRGRAAVRRVLRARGPRGLLAAHEEGRVGHAAGEALGREQHERAEVLRVVRRLLERHFGLLRAKHGDAASSDRRSGGVPADR